MPRKKNNARGLALAISRRLAHQFPRWGRDSAEGFRVTTTITGTGVHVTWIPESAQHQQEIRDFLQQCGYQIDDRMVVTL